MEGSRSPPVTAQGGGKPKFSVRRPSFSAGAKPCGIRPYPGDLLLLLFLIVGSYFCLSYLSSWEKSIIGIFSEIGFTADTAGKTIKTAQITISLFLSITSLAFLRAFVIFIAPNLPPKPSQSEKPKPNSNSESNKKPPKSKPIYEPLVPVRKPLFTQTPPRVKSDQFTSSAERKSAFSPLSPSRTPPVPSPIPSWSSLRSNSGKRIQSEETLQKFLEETDAKIDRIWDSPVSSSSKRTAGTPPAGTPLSGTGKGRPVRMSPSSVSPSKKGDGDLIPPMSMEKINEGFKNLGVSPQIEQWRDLLRQWFSSVLINPLLQKIQTSHIQVMQAASSVGYSIKVSQVGSEVSLSSPVQSSPVTGWQPIVTLDEDELLYKLQSSLLQTLNKPPPQQTFGSVQQQNNPPNQFIQACLDAVTEHQRLKSLMKGDLIKNLLPQIIINPNYTVTRIQDLAEGTCLKNYNYMGTGYSPERKWTGDLPSDSHLLLYFFSAFLEHPSWTLRNDTQWFSGSESNENPLFLGILPPKERFPEKYVAVVVGPPPVLHPGALVLSVGKQSPPGFCLYWNKKLQFSLQGRTAFWDAILLLCYKINEDYDGVVRGVHLGSPALNLLPIFDSDSEA